MEAYEKKGYLNSQFRLFHLTDCKRYDFTYHYHDFDKIIIFLRGDVTYHIEGNCYQLTPHDIVLISHHEIHKPSIGQALPYERVILYLAPDFIANYQTIDCDLNYCFSQARREHSHVMRANPAELNTLLQSIQRLEHAYTHDGYANELLCQVLFLEFIIQLNRAALDSLIHYLPALSYPPKIFRIISYINEHLTDDLTIDILADQFYLSKYHMMRMFKAETGYTIGQYITKKRLLLAKELLKQHTPVTAVCFDCGFQNYSTFSRAYKSMFGESPRSTCNQIPEI